ncbi:MAG: hypothetical protein EA349_06030 [Halomonadaceae bacterium]|nr:MAG: hypothetical protein EA349_06030 [Halomonadaceae bacterium]
MDTGCSKKGTLVGGFLLAVIMLCLSLSAQAGQVITVNTPGSYNYTVPGGVVEVTVELWGGGGRGGSAGSWLFLTSGQSGGGGGGAYARSTLAVTPGQVIPLQVGAGSTTTARGEDSWFAGPAVVRAAGGRSVGNNSTSGGTGGAVSESVGGTRYAGGNGGNATTQFSFLGTRRYGGGGGSSAGINSGGANGASVTPGTAPPGGGNGGAGDNDNQNPGFPGVTPGGGGGGATYSSLIIPRAEDGGAGGNGQIRLTEILGEGLQELRLNTPANPNVCEPANIVLTAYNSSGEIMTDYDGTVSLSTSNGVGDWSRLSALGTLNPDPHDADDGSAQYSFVPGDGGEVTLGLRVFMGSTLSAIATDSQAGVTVTSDSMTFRENAFSITVEDPLGEDFVAGREHAIQVEALSRAGGSTNCRRLRNYSGVTNLKAWVTRVADDPGGNGPRVAGEAARLPDSEPGGNNLTLTFNQGLAQLGWETDDVGRYRLNLHDPSPSSGGGSMEPIFGSSDLWSVRPFGFEVTVTGNPAASEASGPAFIAAGRPMTVNLRAVAWRAANDSNNDGRPDGHDNLDMSSRTNLSANSTTASFTPASGQLELSADLVAGPTNPAEPPLELVAAAGAFSGGQGQAVVRYNEVGSISILAEHGGNYLGRAATVLGRSDYVGRFHPEQFQVTATPGRFAPVCGDFVYSGQPHGYDLAPELVISPLGFVDTGPGPLLGNYRQQWQRLLPDDVSRTFPETDEVTELAVTVDAFPPQLMPLGDGRMEYLFEGDQYTFEKTLEARQDPFTSALSILITGIDDGDASLDPAQSPLELQPDGVEIRYGRLRLENVYGPEQEDLEIPLRAETLQNGNFVLNLQDDAVGSEDTLNCFTFRPSQEDEVQLSPENVAVNVSGPGEHGLFMGESQPGEGVLLRSATVPPVPGNNSVRVTLQLELFAPWLQDIDNDDEPVNPSAMATFGVYRGHDRIIYWQERSN